MKEIPILEIDLKKIIIILILIFSAVASLSILHYEFLQYRDNIYIEERNTHFTKTISALAHKPETTEGTTKIVNKVLDSCKDKDKYNKCVIEHLEKAVFDTISYEEITEDHEVEKILENKIGDCIHKSILFSSFLKEINIDSYLVTQKEHMCVKYYLNGWKDFNCFNRPIKSITRVR